MPASPATVVAEYPTRFEADVAVACLSDHGIESRMLADPAHSVAPHLVTMRGFRVEVRSDDVDLAREALGLDQPPDPVADELDRAYFRVPFSQRPLWIRWTAIVAIVAVAGPAALSAAILVLTISWRLLPG